MAGDTGQEPANGAFRMRIHWLVSLLTGLVVLVSVGSVLAFTITSARQDMLSSLASQFDLTTSALVRQIDTHLSVVDQQLDYVGDWLIRDPTVSQDNDRLTVIMRAALAATPQVTAIAFMRPDRTSFRLERQENREFVDDLKTQKSAVEAMRRAQARGPDAASGNWSEPLYSRNIGRSIIVKRHPVWRNGQYLGMLFAGVDLFALSRYAKELSDSIGQTVFIIHGRQRLIAHKKIVEGRFDLSEEKPMPGIGEIGDPILLRIWDEDRRPIITQSRMRRGDGHFLYSGNWFDVYVYIYESLNAYGKTPWLVGFHYDSSQHDSPVGRFWLVSSVGVALLFVFVGVGMLFGRRMARPIQHLTETAAAVEQLDLAKVSPMPRSRIIELDRAASAFNAMVTGLRVFERYIPKRLVERIIRDGQETIEAEERQITVMFTDIVGFSTLAEHKTPPETAAFLNAHFAIVGSCVEAGSGTIDKYIGDGLLAFWGAPERLEDQADHACRAALEIRRKIAKDNESRRTRGELPVHLRIGIHTGNAIVGDIGAETRVNYTVIGDAVNIASRVESAGRGHMQGDVTVLVTKDTLDAAATGFAVEPIGPTELQGRSQPVELFLLADGG